MLEMVFSNQRSCGRDDDDRHGLIDQRNRSVLELACRITFRVDIGNFLELQRALKRQRVTGAATEIEHMFDLAEIAADSLDLFFQPQRLSCIARNFG